MTTETYEAPPVYTVSGVGPYAVNHEYNDGALTLFVELDSVLTLLSSAEFTADPVSTEDSGNVFLTTAAAAAYDGGKLFITRDTDVEQGWVGLRGNREKSLERQIDVHARAIQDLQTAIARTLRVGPNLNATTFIAASATERAQTTLMWSDDGSTIVAGPDAAQIQSAEEQAALAALSAVDAQSAAASINTYASYAEAAASNVPAVVNQIFVKAGKFVIAFSRDAAGTALITNGGARWSPSDDITALHFGAVGDGSTDDSAAFQAAADYCAEHAVGVIIVPPGHYRVAGLDYGPFCHFVGVGQARVELPDGANTYLARGLGYDAWGDSVASTTAPVSVKRSFLWHSSPAARNSVAAANQYVVGQVIVTRSTDPTIIGDWFNGDLWWEAVSVNPSTGFADRDEDWASRPSLLGAFRSGFSNLQFFGNKDNQVGAAPGIQHYGIRPTFRNIEIEKFNKWGLDVQAAGFTFSNYVDASQQGEFYNIRVTECGDAQTGNIFYDGQSDTNFYDIFSFEPNDDSFALYLGSKASGFRIYGIHNFGPDIADVAPLSENWSIWSDAPAGYIAGDAEGRCRFIGPRNRIDLKIYRSAPANQVLAPALYIEDPKDSTVSVRTYLFRNCIRIVGEDKGGNDFHAFLDAPGMIGTQGIDTTFGAAISETSRANVENSENASDRFGQSGGSVLGPRLGVTRATFGDRDAVDRGLGFTSVGVQIIHSATEQILVTDAETIFRNPARLTQQAFALLDALTVSAGAVAVASDARRSGETAGNGTGCPIWFDGQDWRTFYDNSIVQT
ncbi:MAG: glycosyl hydrolase family 28-related protein [Pseudomonadota bacterium]